MPNTRHWDVRNIIPVRDKDGQLVLLTKANADRVEELLSADRIKEHIAAQNLIDNGAILDEPAPKKKVS